MVRFPVAEKISVPLRSTIRSTILPMPHSYVPNFDLSPVENKITEYQYSYPSVLPVMNTVVSNNSVQSVVLPHGTFRTVSSAASAESQIISSNSPPKMMPYHDHSKHLIPRMSSSTPASVIPLMSLSSAGNSAIFSEALVHIEAISMSVLSDESHPQTGGSPTRIGESYLPVIVESTVQDLNGPTLTNTEEMSDWYLTPENDMPTNLTKFSSESLKSSYSIKNSVCSNSFNSKMKTSSKIYPQLNSLSQQNLSQQNLSQQNSSETLEPLKSKISTEESIQLKSSSTASRSLSREKSRSLSREKSHSESSQQLTSVPYISVDVFNPSTTEASNFGKLTTSELSSATYSVSEKTRFCCTSKRRKQPRSAKKISRRPRSKRNSRLIKQVKNLCRRQDADLVAHNI